MLIKDWYHLESNHDKQNPDKALVMMNRMNRIQDVDGFCPSTHSQPLNALLKSGSNFFSRCNFRPLCLRGGSGVAACRNVEVHCINMRKQPHVFTHRQIDVLEFQTCMAGVLHFRCETSPGTTLPRLDFDASQDLTQATSTEVPCKSASSNRL